MSGKKRLGPPDPRAQMHFKSLPRKDWLPVHYEDWVGDAERMITLMREQKRETDADAWQVEYERRTTEAQKAA